MKTNVRIEIMLGVVRDKDGRIILPLRAEQQCLKLIESACRKFGRAAMHATEGGWINGDGKLVMERGCVLVIYTTYNQNEQTEYASVRENIHALCDEAKVLLNQEAVMVAAHASGISLQTQ